jgi:hypothetical protein
MIGRLAQITAFAMAIIGSRARELFRLAHFVADIK